MSGLSNSKLTRYWVNHNQLFATRPIGSGTYTPVIEAAEVDGVLDDCRQVLIYLIERHEASKVRSVTIDWSKATRLLARLEGK